MLMAVILTGRVILKLPVPKIMNKDITASQDKQPFAVGVLHELCDVRQ
jgi:hypothetical protein